MLLKAVVFLVLFGLIGVGRAWGQEIGTSSRLELCLNGNWLRSAGGDGSVLPDEGWENVRVPEFHADSLKGSAWFRLDFAIALRIIPV